MLTATMEDRQRGKLAGKVALVTGGARGLGRGYGVAKAGIIHYTQSLAAELGPYQINVNAIARRSSAPAASATAVPWPIRYRCGARAPSKTCAKVVEFLTTDLSDYVTGETILIGGGRH